MTSSGIPENPNDAITASEMTSTTIASTQPIQKRPNAFTELMAPKKLKASEPSKMAHKLSTFPGRDGLGAYITHPESSPRVIQYNDSFVLIRDLYPKASIHLLLLPRDPVINQTHPLEAFNLYPEFLAEAKKMVKDDIIPLAAAELRRMYGKESASDREYQDALAERMISPASVAASPHAPTPVPTESSLSKGRDWAKEIRVGVHGHPSMSHLHIHILSREMHSQTMKHYKHYNSFNTPFFVELDDFPLKEGDPRLEPDKHMFIRSDFVCWRCGKRFPREKFKRLKEHVEDEFEVWKRE
ncbi:HIT-like protein [Delitschia confertaspora ATCC 74209]|uniref:HIT-like protein n=1 Tax=Delitschia confertaspora ATCC 74209 TaxID=1513339 RepID=A0A9P4N3C9_9PLEO|nr:HIT-like protein [Delitschia confertaspora ATCC 74209]